jgi:hypothetical protein
VQRLSPLFTGNLPRPLSGGPHRADLRQACPKRLRPAHQCGRWNPYAAAKASLAAALSILPLMASIVRSPVWRLQLAALGLPTLFAPCRLAAGPGAVTLATVAATTDGEGSLAAPAVAQVKNRNLARQHRGLPAGMGSWTTATRLCEAPPGCVGASVPSSAGPRKRTQNPGAYRGFLSPAATRPSIPLPRPPLPPSQNTPLPPRFARDDDAAQGWLPT